MERLVELERDEVEGLGDTVVDGKGTLSAAKLERLVVDEEFPRFKVDDAPEPLMRSGSMLGRVGRAVPLGRV